jgi:chromosome segregation ATPase
VINAPLTIGAHVLLTIKSSIKDYSSTHLPGHRMSSYSLKTEESAESNIRNLRDLHARLSELSRPRDLRNARHPVAEIRGEQHNDIVAQLETLVGLVESSQNVIDDLVSKMKDHEETVYDLKNRLSEAEAQKDEAYQNAARAEGAIRAEKDRAEIAEARAKSAEEEVRFLQNRDSVVRERINRLTASVNNLASTGQIKSPFMASGLTRTRGAADHAA